MPQTETIALPRAETAFPAGFTFDDVDPDVLEEDESAHLAHSAWEAYMSRMLAQTLLEQAVA